MINNSTSTFDRSFYIGRTYGYLTIDNVFEDPNKNNRPYAECTCRLCHNKTIAPLYSLTSGTTVSCGCYRNYLNSRAGKFERYMNYYVYLDPYTVRVFFNNEPDKSMLVDTSTWIYLSKYIWSYHKSSGYASTTLEDGKFAAYHYLILECPDGYVRDHINRDRLDNRLCNLRVITQEANCYNRSIYPTNKFGVKGISYDKSSPNKPYVAFIKIPNPNYMPGVNKAKRQIKKRFAYLEDAIDYRKMLEKKYYKIESLTTKKLNYEPNAIGVVEFRPDNYDQIPPYDFKSHPIV